MGCRCMGKCMAWALCAVSIDPGNVPELTRASMAAPHSQASTPLLAISGPSPHTMLLCNLVTRDAPADLRSLPGVL